MEPAARPVAVGRLWAEFVVLFVAVPVAHVAFFDILGPFLPFIAVFVAAAILLSLTDGFHWREVVDFQGFGRHLPMLLGLAAVCAGVIFGLVLVFFPERLFSFPRNNPERFALVIVLYPFFSALGQEIAYRLLFFHRYRGLFPNEGTAVVASALVFSGAHAVFQNWIAIVLTLIAGLAFAWVYARTASFPFVWILHSLAGQLVFTSGLGVFFYHGAIPG